MPKRRGRKSAAQTPAPPKERITGSKKNPKGSASSESTAKGITLSDKIIETLKNKLAEFKKKHPNKKNVTLNDLKAVFRRGAGAYSKSHRPTITGGVPNSRNAWAFARVNKFLKKAGGEKVKAAYVQDDDLLKMEGGGATLLAPNGKPSNLTPEQWNLVRTSEFKNWFGDWENDPENASKVVDENGEPLVVFHGAKRKFYTFKKKKNVSDKNPFFKSGFWFFSDPIGESLSQEDREYFYEEGNARWMAENWVEDADGNSSSIVLECFLNVRNPIEVDSYAEFLEFVEDDKVKKSIEKRQVDGWFIHGSTTDGGVYRDDINVIDSSQIKLADGSNVTFDPTNKDIRFEDGGKMKKGALVGGYEDINDEWLSRKIEIFLDKVKPIKYYFVDPETNTLVVGFDKHYSTDAAEKFYKEATSSKEFFDADSVESAYDNKTGDTIFKIKLKNMVEYKKGGETKKPIKKRKIVAKGDCYVKAGEFAMGKVFAPAQINYIGTPYVVHAEVVGQGIIEGIRYGHAWVEDDYFVYDYSNGRELQVPKELYYAIGQVNKYNRKKYRRYTFAQAKKKMLETGHYGCWDIETEYAIGGETNESCEKLDSKGERKIDPKSIEELTKCVESLPQTKTFYFDEDKEQYSPERRELHRKIIYDIKKNITCIEKRKPIAILMGGSPASGKSTFVRKYAPYLMKDDILKVDADEIRAKLPEYKGYNASQTHLETKDIVTTLLSDRNIGLPCTYDILYDGTMNNVKNYEPLVRLLKSLGYSIYIIYIDKVPKDVVKQRNLDRYKRTGRFVPLAVIDDFFEKGTQALDKLKPQVDGYMVVDGSDGKYSVIEKGGKSVPKTRSYEKIGYHPELTAKDVIKEFMRGGRMERAKDASETINNLDFDPLSSEGSLNLESFEDGGETNLKKTTFSDRYGKNRFVELSKDDLNDYAEELLGLIQNSYKHLGGHHEFLNLENFKNTELNFWVAQDLDSDPEADVLLAGKTTPFGTKITTSGQDGSTTAKMAMVKKMTDLMRTEGFYAEMDENLANKFNLDIITDENVIRKVINKPDLVFVREGVYTRAIGGQYTKEKVLVGMPPKDNFAKGGELSEDEKKETYKKWKTLVNMSKGELKKFYDSIEGKRAGLTPEQAKSAGIDSGRESARWIMKMKDTPVAKWTPNMWRWAKKQISFVSRMSGNKGSLYDEKGRKTRKHTSLLIWGHNPEKKSAGGTIDLKSKGYDMNEYIFNNLPCVDGIEQGQKFLLKEEVFVKGENEPKHHRTRYMVVQAMSRGGMLDSLNLKVLYTFGEDSLMENQIITRPIKNVLNKGREISETIKSSFKDGGQLDPDKKEIKGYVEHISGSAGGLLVGKRHSEGGIKAINKSTGDKIEMEGGEVVITRDAVSDPSLHEFNGKKMTNREILSAINESGGGVAFADGGDVSCKCAGKSYKFGGKLMTDKEIVERLNRGYGSKDAIKKGMEIEDKEHGQTFKLLQHGDIDYEKFLKRLVTDHLSEDPNYYENYKKHGKKD